MIVSGRRLVSGGRLLAPGWVSCVDGKIVAVGDGPPPGGHPAAIAGDLVVPGFVDIHVHGGGGASFDDADSTQHRAVVAFHRRHGTTAMAASLMSAPVDELARQLSALAALVRSGDLLGVHLEGPWLSIEHAGAHDPALLRPPVGADVQRLLEAGGAALAMVTLAPELPGAITAVSALHRAEVVVAIGHTGADAQVTRAAVDAGATVATHLFNAMGPVHHREAGAALALLDDDRVVVELIADGVHVHPAALRLAIRAKGPARVAMVTDATAPAGQPDGATRLGTQPVQVTGGIARLDGTSTLAGSTLTMDRAFRTLVQMCGMDLVDASAMTATTPASTLGRTDIGDLKPGRDADLVVLDADLHVTTVLRRGTPIPRS